jgi:uncharacterized membrane protein
LGIIAGLLGFTAPTYTYGDDPTDVYQWFLDTAVSGIKQGYWLVFLIVGLVSLVISFFQTGAAYAMNAGLTHYFVGVAAGNPTLSISSLFSRLKYFWKMTIAAFLVNLFTLLWSLLLFVPGIIASYRYAMVPYILAERPDTPVMEAFAESKALMNGRKMRLFCLQLSFIGWGLLAMLTCGIGLYVLGPYMRIAEATFFLDATGYDLQSVVPVTIDPPQIPTYTRPTPPPDWNGK